LQTERTVLHYAAKLGFYDAVKLLLEQQIDANVVDKDGNTPLHLAAMENNSSVIDVLLKVKANADCLNKREKWPYQLAADGQLKRILREARFAILYAAGTVTPKAMKLCIIGPAGAGKTTLLEALKRGRFRSLFTWESQRDDPQCELDRTVGVNVMTVDIPGVGRFSLHDYAGQEQFHKTHGLFFSALNSFFILLISLLTGEDRRPCTFQEFIDVARYWLSFLRASLEAGIIPTVMIVASRGDHCPSGQVMLQQVVSQMRDLFKGKIKIREECFLLDCRKSWSQGMQQLRQLLKQVRTEYLQSGFRYPRLCEPVTANLLPALRQKKEEPFMETEELVDVIEKEECPGQERKVVDKVVDFLDETGEILHVESVVSLNPSWLSEYAVGPLMAPPHMKWHANAPGGRMTKEEAERVIKLYLHDKKINIHVKIDHIFKALMSMGLIFKLEDGLYLFPAHLPLKALDEMWEKDSEKPVYVGRRYLCSSEASIFSPSAFTLFQCWASVQLTYKSVLWRDGMIVTPAAAKCFVQCLVLMRDHLKAIDFVARGGVGSESECLSLVHDVMRDWRDIVDKYSPGTEYKMAYLSRKHLIEHVDPPALYTEEDVENAKMIGPSRFVAHDFNLAETLTDLMVSLPEKQYSTARSAVVRAIVAHGCSQWYEFGLQLEFTDDSIMEYCHNIPEHSGKLLVLLGRKAKEMSSEIFEEFILNACKRLPRPIYGRVKDDLDKLVAGDTEAVVVEI
jgi:GTPase SAR1 family protein